MAGISPDAFWQMSPQEIYIAIEGFSEYAGGQDDPHPMERSELETLMELYPD